MKYLIAIYLPIVKINLNYFIKEIFHSQMRKKNISLTSANKSIYIFEENILRRSLIYNTNKIGPTTDPCGTPNFTIELF